jgi:hypothetical protein
MIECILILEETNRWLDSARENLFSSKRDS